MTIVTELKLVAASELEPNPHQPRTKFDKEKLNELAESIKWNGILQPIIVRQKGSKYQIVAGERRWRAARLAGIEKIPVLVRETADKKLLLESLLENIQREDLTSIERENAIYELWKSGEYPSQRDLAKSIGFTAQWVSDLIEAKEFRERVGVRLPDNIASTLIRETRELDDKTRLKVIGLAEEGELRQRPNELREVVSIVKSAPSALKEALVSGQVDFEHAREAVELYDEVKKNSRNPVDETRLLEYVEELKRTQKGEETQRKIRRNQVRDALIGQAKMEPLQQFHHWADELEQDPPDVQEGNRLRWNLQRIDKMAQKLHLPPSFYTTSYSGRDVATLVKLMKAGEVGTVYDVRDTPFSQFRPEFNKESIAKALKEAGIEYKHVPELGVKREVRDELAKSGDYKAFWKKYDDGLKTKEKHDIIEKIGKEFDEAQSEPFALLCTERDPHKCHRHRLALYLMEEWSVESLDI